MPWIEERKWRAIHANWHRSPQAKAMKRRLLFRQHGRCARCGTNLPPWGGVLNLTSYEDMNAGRTVKDSDANLLHRSCHPKGTYSWQKLQKDKEMDFWLRVIAACTVGPFVFAWHLFRYVWRFLKPEPGVWKRLYSRLTRKK